MQSKMNKPTTRTLARRLAFLPFALTAVLWTTFASGAAPDFPPLTGRVVDQASMLSAGSRTSLTEELAAHEQKTGQQVVIVTLPTLAGHAIEDYGYQLGRHWGIGRAERDDGTLLIVAQAERQIRIEVGYGLEGTLTDALSWDIIQSRMVPLFRAGDFDAGIVAGTRAILGVLAGDPTAATPPEQPDERNSLAGLIFWIFVVVILLNGFGGRRRGRLGRAILAGSALGGPRGFPTGGGFGGGGFGGGGFGGRGGGFGGGGASGGW
jgi:uncharacterized protein